MRPASSPVKAKGYRPPSMEPWYTRKGAQEEDGASNVGVRSPLVAHKYSKMDTQTVPGPGSYFIKAEQDPKSPLGPNFDKYTSFKTCQVTGGSLATSRGKEVLKPQYRDRMGNHTGGGCSMGRTKRLTTAGKQKLYNGVPGVGTEGSFSTDPGTAPGSYRHQCSLGDQGTFLRVHSCHDVASCLTLFVHICSYLK
jgi:hypothetical protein